MSVVARGIYSGPVAALSEMLSNCASVQALLQAVNAAAALAEIVAFGQGGDHARPLVLVGFDDVARESSTRGHFLPGGRLTVSIEIPFRWEATLTAVGSVTSFTATGLALLADDFFNGLNAVVGSQAAVAISDFATAGVLTVSALGALPNVGDALVIEPASISDGHTYAMNIVGDIQAELEARCLQSGGLNIHSIKLADYGRMLAQQDDGEEEYFGAKLEVEFGV